MDWKCACGKPIGACAVPEFTTGVAKPLTQIEPGNIGDMTSQDILVVFRRRVPSL